MQVWDDNNQLQILAILKTELLPECVAVLCNLHYNPSQPSLSDVSHCSLLSRCGG
jgi:hypothetical protein